MDNMNINITPGTGLGDIKFGMLREQVEKILGKPDHQEISMYEDENEKLDAWVYNDLSLDLSFEEAEDWRLVIISVSSDQYLLNGKSLIGLEMEELLDELNDEQIEDLEIEDLSSKEAPDQKLISSEEHGINFWVNDGILEEIQWSPRIAEDNTIVWP